jgi:S1-C subfamily serine protease
MNASIKLLEAVLPAVVSLKADIPASHPSAGVLGTERHGSGVLIEEPDLILTVNYVVLGARAVEVTLIDGSAMNGRVVGQDFGSGIALIQIDSPAQRGLSARRSTDLLAGEDVAIVAAAADNVRRVSDGVVSSFARFDANWEYSLERSLITTARNPGFGGAPLIDTFGRVAGVVSLDLGEVGRFTLAIPIDNYLDHKSELLMHGRRVSRPARAWVGLFCYTLQDHVVVAGLLPGSPADQAGLKPGDVVMAIDDREINARQELYEALWSLPPGRVVSLRIFRDNEVRQVGITTADAEQFFA